MIWELSALLFLDFLGFLVTLIVSFIYLTKNPFNKHQLHTYWEKLQALLHYKLLLSIIAVLANQIALQCEFDKNQILKSQIPKPNHYHFGFFMQVRLTLNFLVKSQSALIARP